MAVYDLEEQEKIEDLKAWWAQYGKYVSAAVTADRHRRHRRAGLALVPAHQAEQASVLYQAVSDAARANDLTKAKDPATQIVQRYAGTAYAPRAALLVAKLLYDKDDKAGAKRELQWVIDHSDEDELKAIARFRLAEVLLDEKKYDDALRTLDAKTDDAFAALYADLGATSSRPPARTPKRARRTRSRSPRSIPSRRTGRTSRSSSTRSEARSDTFACALALAAAALLLGGCQSLPASWTSWMPSLPPPSLAWLGIGKGAPKPGPLPRIENNG